MPDSAAVRQPTSAARSASSLHQRGAQERLAAGDREHLRVVVRGEAVDEARRTARRALSSLVNVEFVAQCAQLSGQRRVSASDTPAAGTGRSASSSTRCKSAPLSLASAAYAKHPSTPHSRLSTPGSPWGSCCPLDPRGGRRARAAERGEASQGRLRSPWLSHGPGRDRTHSTDLLKKSRAGSHH